MNFKADSNGRARDVRYFSPDDLNIKAGFNARTFFNQERLKELSKSIFNNGFFDSCPIECRMEDGKLYVVDGERRLRAVKMAIQDGMELESIPVILVEKGANEADDVVKMLNKNGQGEPLNPLEEAEAIGRLKRWGWDNKKISDRIGRSVARVRAALDLLSAAPETMQATQDGLMSASTAGRASKLSPDKQKKLVAKAKTTGKRVKLKDVEKEQHGRRDSILTSDIEKFLVKVKNRDLFVDIPQLEYEGRVWAVEEILKLAK